MYSSTSASEWVCSWMNSMRSFSWRSSETTEACAMPSEASSVEDFTNIGKRSRFGSRGLRPRANTTNCGVGTR